MTMIKRGATSGRIESYSSKEDAAITCKACGHIIVSEVNLIKGHICPFCHNDINKEIGESSLVKEEGDDIARPC